MLRIGPCCTIEDRGSANGVRIRSRALVPMEPVEIAFGDMIELGSVLIMVQHRPAPSTSAAGWMPSRPHGHVAERREVQRDASARGGFDEARVPRGALQPDPAVIERVAAGTISVLILGETGVGKEILAERIHRASPRADRPLVRLNCVALSATLLESELFGYEKGAFTGAASAKLGLIEAAEGGTVFLDEIGDLPMAVQVKLLRVLESREILPVGGVKPRAVDVRFISATNVDLEAEIERGGFRADLYYRLNGVTLYVRPLRQRVHEIAGLAEAFIADACRGLGRTRYPVLSPEALRLLEGCRWPGNIRELRNVIERAILFCTTDTIQPEQLAIENPNRAGQSAPAMVSPIAPQERSWPRQPVAGPTELEAGVAHEESMAMTVQRELEMLEKQRILQALQTCAGNQSRAAKLLAIPRRTLLKRLDTYRIPRPRKRGSSAQSDAEAEPAKAWPARADKPPRSSETGAAPCDTSASPAGTTAIDRGRA